MSATPHSQVVREGIKKDILTCLICLEVFKEPKKLPCDHVYCKGCLEGLLEDGTITCPECRYIMVLEDGDVNNIPVPFQISRIKDLYESIPVARYPCERHETQDLSHYCENCDALLCRDCVLKSDMHTQHNCEFIYTVVDQHRRTLTDAIDRTKSLRESFSTGLEKLEIMREDIMHQGGQLKEQIERGFEEFQKILIKQKEALLASVDEDIRKKAEQVTEQEQHLRDQLTSISNTIEAVNTTTNQGNEVLLKHKTKNMEKLKNAQDTLNKLSVNPVQQPDIGLVFKPKHFKKQLKKSCYKYTLPDPTMCVFDTTPLLSLTEGKQASTTLSLIDSECQPCKEPQLIDGVLQSLYDGSIVHINVTSQEKNPVSIYFTPVIRGRHTLTIKVNNVHVANSPFKVFVHKLPEELNQPVAVIRDISPFGGLECSDEQLIIPEVDKISVLDRRSKQLKKTLKQPAVTDVAVDPVSKALFASDKYNHMIHKYSADGRYIRGVGGHGKQPGMLQYPGGIAVCINKEGKYELYVCDVGNNRIQAFDMNLYYKEVCQTSSKLTYEYITFSDYGTMYCTETSTYQIAVVCPNGEVNRRIRKQGKINNPMGIRIFGDYLYVVNCSKRGSVSVFKLRGEFISSFGEGLLHNPQGIAIDVDGFVYVTSDSKGVYVF